MSAIADLGAAALRRLDPELAHNLAIGALRAGLGPRLRAARWPRLETELAGLSFPNPLGLAAGFDKNCEVAAAFLEAGFGFVEAGTVTPKPQAGNPRPRLFRVEDAGAVINRMGFNNEGLDGFAPRLAKASAAGVVGANIGANKDSADRVGDYVTGLKAVWECAAYVVVNVSSPNTPGLRGLQERGALEELLGRLAEARGRLPGRRPLFLKIAPDLDESAARDIVELAAGHGLDGLVVSNTTLARPPDLGARWSGEAGGLSGKPLFEPSTRLLRTIAAMTVGRLALIGVGGVASGANALAKIKAGASAVQLYTALVYGGLGLVERILSDLSARLAAEGFKSLTDAVGADLR